MYIHEQYIVTDKTNSPIGLDLRTLKDAKRAVEWQEKGGFYDCKIYKVQARNTLVNIADNSIICHASLDNSIFIKEAWADFLIKLEGLHNDT